MHYHETTTVWVHAYRYWHVWHLGRYDLDTSFCVAHTSSLTVKALAGNSRAVVWVVQLLRGFAQSVAFVSGQHMCSAAFVNKGGRCRHLSMGAACGHSYSPVDAKTVVRLRGAGWLPLACHRGRRVTASWQHAEA